MALKKYLSVSPTALGLGGRKRIAVVRTSGALRPALKPPCYVTMLFACIPEGKPARRPAGAIVSGGGGGPGSSGQITAETIIKQLRAIGKQKVPASSSGTC